MAATQIIDWIRNADHRRLYTPIHESMLQFANNITFDSIYIDRYSPDAKWNFQVYMSPRSGLGNIYSTNINLETDAGIIKPEGIGPALQNLLMTITSDSIANVPGMNLAEVTHYTTARVTTVKIFRPNPTSLLR